MENRQTHPLANYVRVHRKKTGLSRRDLSLLLGYVGEGQVPRHERLSSLPPLTVAVAYEIVFRVPIAELFPGLRGRVEQEIERRLDVLRAKLEQESGKDRHSATTAHKLEWIAMRRESA
jgi:DNA-binding XRE family transcriptional regulator